MYLGEDGSIEDITIELVEISTRADLCDTTMTAGARSMGAWARPEFSSAFTMWVNAHFWIVSPDDADVESFDASTFFDWVADYEGREGVRV